MLEELDEDHFIATSGYLKPLADDSEVECKILHENGALVMECGMHDLAHHIEEKGALSGEDLRSVAHTAAKCIDDMHSKDMVWTEVKSDNFVVVDEGGASGRGGTTQVKGIDVESAVGVGDNPVDFTPKACPPEFAIRYLCGTEPYEEMQQSFDIWSFGMLAYELSTGKNYFDGICDVEICKHLKNSPEVDVSRIPSSDLRDLAGRCLTVDPERRPTIREVLNHPFFRS